MHLSSLQLACAALATLALVAAAPPASPHHVARRAYFTNTCKGAYNASLYAEIDSICDDCYNYFKKAEVYNLCKKDCFTTDEFEACVKLLQYSHKLDRFKEIIISLHGYDPKDLFDSSDSDTTTSTTTSTTSTTTTLRYITSKYKDGLVAKVKLR